MKQIISNLFMALYLTFEDTKKKFMLKIYIVDAVLNYGGSSLVASSILVWNHKSKNIFIIYEIISSMNSKQ